MTRIMGIVTKKMADVTQTIEDAARKGKCDKENERCSIENGDATRKVGNVEGRMGDETKIGKYVWQRMRDVTKNEKYVKENGRCDKPKN